MEVIFRLPRYGFIVPFDAETENVGPGISHGFIHYRFLNKDGEQISKDGFCGVNYFKKMARPAGFLIDGKVQFLDQ